MRKRIIPVLLSVTLLMSGCGNRSSLPRAQVKVEGYEKITYETVEVERGDIEPFVELQLTAGSFERKSYFPALDEMRVAEVHVQEGDSVLQGDVLISFQSGDIEQRIAAYEGRIEENLLLIDHYTRLQEIEASVDYSADIVNLKEDNEIAKLYIEELGTTLDFYSIRAERTGSVAALSSLLDYGEVSTQDNVITMIYGNGEYDAETTDDYDFQVGQIFSATYGVATYEVELVSIEEAGKDVDGNTIKKLKFRATENSADTSARNKLNIAVNKTVLKDVLYIPKNAVFAVDNKEYVYLLDENGFRYAREITTQGVVDGFAIIRTGLVEGDRVVVDD